jgi:hypothetical protein
MSYRWKYIMLIFSLLSVAFIPNSVFGGAKEQAAATNKKGVITGKIMIKDGGPLSGGQVLFYNASSGPPPLMEEYTRTPDIVRHISDDGSFNVELSPGNYYLRAVRRQSGERMGLPQAGDYFYSGVDEKGKLRLFTIKAGKTLDVGTISESVLLTAESFPPYTITTAIEGVIADTEGKPVRDAVVVAFQSASISGKPLFVSEKTDKNGKYVLRLTAGTYYLRARNLFASGPPEPGQIVGYYGDGVPAPITVKEGELKKGINFQVILFPGRGPFSGMAPPKQ